MQRNLYEQTEETAYISSILVHCKSAFNGDGSRYARKGIYYSSAFL
jgi:hypothetical protein